MKKRCFLALCLIATLTVQAQISKTVNCTAGALTTLLSTTEKATITDLTITGVIDSRDFVTMRNMMPLLKSIDMNLVTIAAYGSNPANSIIVSAFSGRKSLSSIILPSSVTSIGNDAFGTCSGLTSFTIPLSVTSIGDYAFVGCTGLTSFTIPLSVTSIGYYAFGGCSCLIIVAVDNPNYSSHEGILFDKYQTSLLNCPISKTGNYTIPSSVTSIGSSAFSRCSGLTSITIPSSVTSIRASAFEGCSGLTSIPIPSSVTSIGSSAFSRCSGLTSITIPSSVDSIRNDVFRGCSGLTSVVIPSSVISIGIWAFYGCSSLTSIVIPSSVISIEKWAFYDCSSLSSVTILASIASIDRDAFSNCSCLIHVDAGNLNYSSTEGVLFDKSQTLLIRYPASKIGSYTIPTSVKTIGSGAFEDCKGLTSVVIPNSVTTIGEAAFYFCSGLTSVVIPDSVTTIKHSAFFQCSGLTSVSIPNSVDSIENNAFDGCKLSSVTIPSSVTYIGYKAFFKCNGLITVDAGNLNYSSNEGVLFNKSQTELIQCVTSKTGNYNIPTTVSIISSYAFYGCSSLGSVFIPSSVKYIDYYALKSCSGLITVDAGNLNYSSNEGVLFNKSQTKLIQCVTSKTGNYNIPTTVTYIDDYAFYGCTGLSSVAIPSSVTYIGYNAFQGCRGLSSISVGIKNPIYLNTNYNFSHVDKSTCILYVSIGSKALYQAASVWKDFQNIVEISNTGVEAIESENIRIYPNPVSESFQIVGLSDFTAISIVNANGQIVLQQNCDANQMIGIASLPKGIYFLRINTNKGVITHKIMKN